MEMQGVNLMKTDGYLVKEVCCFFDMHFGRMGFMEENALSQVSVF